MPLTHLKWNNKDRPVDEVLAELATRETDGGPWTYELMSAMLEEHQERGSRISSTTIVGKCLRSEVLKRTTDYADDPKKMYAAFRGTMFHGRLESNAKPGAIAEARYTCELEGLGELSCSPDLIDVRWGSLYDYKTCKEVPVFDYPWQDHKMQVFINRWIVDHAYKAVTADGEEWDLTTVGHRAKFVPEQWNELWLVYLDDKRTKPILVTKSETMTGKNGKPKKVRVPDLGDDEVMEDLIRERYAEARHYLTECNEEIPPIPEDYAYWEHPLCGFCPVKRQCVDEYVEVRRPALLDPPRRKAA